MPTSKERSCRSSRYSAKGPTASESRGTGHVWLVEGDRAPEQLLLLACHRAHPTLYFQRRGETAGASGEVRMGPLDPSRDPAPSEMYPSSASDSRGVVSRIWTRTPTVVSSGDPKSTFSRACRNRSICCSCVRPSVRPLAENHWPVRNGSSRRTTRSLTDAFPSTETDPIFRRGPGSTLRVTSTWLEST